MEALELSYKCSICKDTEYLFQNGGIQACDCLIAKRKREYAKKVVPERFWNVRFKNLKPSGLAKLTEDRQQRVIDVLKKDPLGSYMLLGPTGVGKTHLLYALVNEAIDARRTVYALTASELLRAAREAEIGNTDFIVDVGKLERTSERGTVHLFVDEMDKVKLTEYAQLFLFDIVNYCYNNPNRVKFSITSNLNPNAFEETYGPAFFRKMRDISHLVVYGK